MSNEANIHQLGETVEGVGKEILNNIKRKSEFVDNVEHVSSVPLFSWIDLNPTELCNRTCIFCPRHDSTNYPNQNLHMPLMLAKKIADELKELNYSGGLIICGHGEPLLHPEIVGFVAAFGNEIHTEIVTNGDPLTVTFINELFSAGLGFMLVSLYDGEHQVEEIHNLFDKAGIGKNQYLLRNRWYSEESDFGLKLTNRAGTVDTGKQDVVDEKKPCYYPHYAMQIDWNGDVLVCVQDWNKRVRFGNIHSDSLMEVWTGKLMNRYRRHLGEGDRKMEPCRNCNVTGTLHGYNHAKAWGH